AAGIEEHPWPAEQLPAGVAVSQYDAIGSPDHPRVIEFARRWELDDEAVARLTATFTAVTDGRRKLVRRNHDELLRYDLERDPEERWPLDAEGAGAGFDDLLAALRHPALG